MSRMTLSEPVMIPDPYREIVLEFLRNYQEGITWELRNHFGVEWEIGDIPSSDDDYLRLMIADSLSVIAHAAAGLTSGLDRGEVHDHVQGLAEKLFAIPGEAQYDIPGRFWRTKFGSMVLLALMWGSGEELITIGQAVEITGKAHHYFSHAVYRGNLTAYPDISEPNPTRQTRLLRSQVMALAPKKKRAAR